ncbi:MAG TPA: homoserine O-acetyltransferase [Abditibacteriaceae bacterium]|jgi:homoserine O-acetyltransferase
MLVETQLFTDEEPLRLRCGAQLPGFQLAYETHGTLNAARDNAVLLFHAMTGSHHAAGETPAVAGVDGRWTGEMQSGWWDGFIGPGRAIDTHKFFVICANYLGGCYGSTGPASPRENGEPWSADFPCIRLADIVDSQLRLVDSLGIKTLHAAIGASVGGLLALSLATRYPARVRNVVPIACGIETTIYQRIINFEQINAIESDANFRGGHYADAPPNAGLALARRIAHKTFVSQEALRERARGEIVTQTPPFGWYAINSAIESYMLHQGHKFTARFDANSYLRILDAWQWFDLVREAGAESFDDVFARCRGQKFLVFSIDSDLAFRPEEQQKLVDFLQRADVDALWITVHSEKGHDSFLLEPRLYAPHLRALLDGE